MSIYLYIYFSKQDEDDFDWTLSHGSLKTATGPLTDQGSSVVGDSDLQVSTAGGYAYIDSSYPRHEGDKAMLVLEDYIKTGPGLPLCFSFYINLFGSGLGSLKVVLQVFITAESV